MSNLAVIDANLSLTHKAVRVGLEGENVLAKRIVSVTRALEDDHVSNHSKKSPLGLAGVFLPAWLAPELVSSVVSGNL